ncbi:hypothetical protein MTO96_021572 [Rhipicephalus appendiculatus]
MHRNLPKGSTTKALSVVPEMGHSEHTFVKVDGSDLRSGVGAPSQNARYRRSSKHKSPSRSANPRHSICVSCWVTN